MDVQYSPEVLQWAEGLPLIAKASELLAVALGPKRTPEVKAEWTRIRDIQGQTRYRLRIWDSKGEASTEFTLAELRNPLHMHGRIYGLWDDLLKIHSDLQHERVQMLLAEYMMSQEGT